MPEKITEEYKGDFSRIKTNLNSLIDAMNKTADIAQDISAGNFESDANERSENDRLMKAFNAMIKGLKSVLKEINGLAQSVRDGNLAARGNANAFSGGWQELITGLNSLIDAFVSPITMTTESVNRIAKGDIPDKITDEYKGDFKEIKNSINLMIANLRGAVNVAEKIADGNLDVNVTVLSK